MSPTVDLTSSGASMTERADQDPISTPALLRRFASDYLAGADPKTPLASPLFASLSGLPPLLIQVGTADLLLSDSERLAAAAAEAGVDVTLEIGEGLTHVYQLLLGTPRGSPGHRADPEIPANPGTLTAAVHNTRSPLQRRSSLSSPHPSGDYAVRPPSMCRISPVTYGADSRYRMPSTMSLT